MMSSTFGDMAQHLMLRRQVGDAKTSKLTLTRELSSGLVADTSKRLNGNISELAGIRAALSQASAQAEIGRSAGLFLSVQQTVTDTMRSKIQSSLEDMILMSTDNQDPNFRRTTALMEDRFNDAVSALNTSFAGRSVFGGVSQASKALADADFLLTALITDMTAALPATVDFVAVSTFVDDWFAKASDPDVGPFDSVGYLGGPKLSARLDLGQGQDVGLHVTAQDPAFRKTLATLAKGAILSRGLFALEAAQKDVAVLSMIADLGSANAGLISLSSEIGEQEGSVSKAVAHAEGQRLVLQNAQMALLGADPYETATRLEEVMSRLELLFTLTSRLSRLTLAGFLR